MERNVLFSMTDDILKNGTETEKYHTWGWINTGMHSQHVSKDFMNAWNSCNALDWIEHREHFKNRFSEVNPVKKDYTDLCVILQWINDLYGEGDVIVSEIIYETIYKLKSLS